MSASPRPRSTPEQYLEAERTAEFRSEYYHGHVYAMAGGSWKHATLIHNLDRRLGNMLEGRSCSVRTSDVRLRVSATGLYTYPDVIVVCGEPEFADAHDDIVLNPTLIIEVLSPSTEAYDRGFKSAQYRTLESLREYAFVSQAEPRIEVFHRQAHGQWLLTEFVGLDAVCRFEGLVCEIPLSQVYEKITFEAEPSPPRAAQS